jgi:hypothetical protein
VFEKFSAWKAVAGVSLCAQEFIAAFSRKVVDIIHLVSTRDQARNDQRFVVSIAVSIV